MLRLGATKLKPQQVEATGLCAKVAEAQEQKHASSGTGDAQGWAGCSSWVCFHPLRDCQCVWSEMGYEHADEDLALGAAG